MTRETGSKRVNFFYGRMLSAEDLQAEQNYLVARGRSHNRYAHGWGVLHGLNVRVIGDTVEVSPGVAIDCAGNEIHVRSCVALAMPAEARRLVVLIRYVERGVDPVPVLGSDPGAEAAAQFAFIDEACEVELSPTLAADPHPSQKPGSPGCGEQHPLMIALLRRSRSGWRRTLLARRRS